MQDQTRPADLVEQARQGDLEAFTALFQPLRPQLLAAIRLRLSPNWRNRVDPEDVLQDTFVRALHSLPRFEWQGEDSFSRWVEAIAMHVTLDVVRRQGRRQMLQIDHDVKGDGASPSRAMRRRERGRRLQDALETLSDDHRTVLKLSRMEGLPFSEIAERMNRSEGAVKNLLVRATRKLRESFGETVSLGLHVGSSQDTETIDGE